MKKNSILEKCGVPRCDCAQMAVGKKKKSKMH